MNEAKTYLPLPPPMGDKAKDAGHKEQINLVVWAFSSFNLKKAFLLSPSGGGRGRSSLLR
jgi:hypothetical protein